MSLTTISDTWTNLDGSLLNADCVAEIENGPLTSVGTTSFSRSAVRFQVRSGALIGRNGALALAPNDIANRPNTRYSVRVIPQDGSEATTEKWFVPSSATPVGLRDVRMNEFGQTRAININAVTSYTIPGSLFNLGSNIPIVRVFDGSGNPVMGAAVSRDPVTKDITVGPFVVPQTGSIQLFLTARQYRKAVSAVTGSVSIPASESGLTAVAGWVMVDSAGVMYIEGASVSADLSNLIQTVDFNVGSSPFTGTLVILGF